MSAGWPRAAGRTGGGGVRAGWIRALGPLPALELSAGTEEASGSLWELRGWFECGALLPCSYEQYFGPGTKLTVVGEIWTSLLSAQPLASPEMGGLRWGWGAWPVMPLGGPLCKGGGEYWVGGTGEGYSSPGTRTEGKGGFTPFFPGVFGDQVSNGERIN